jgi:hypothetical protein
MGRFSLVRFLHDMPFWAKGLLVVGISLLTLIGLQIASLAFPGAGRVVATPVPARTTIVTSGPTPTQAPTATPTLTLSPTPVPSPTPTLLPPEGGIIYALKPNVNRVGWVASDQDGNHFGESNLYTGVFEGNIYHGAFQFDLSFIAPGSSIHYAAVELTGLDARRLGGDAGWALQILSADVDPGWPLHGFEQIHQALVAHTLSPVLYNAELRQGAAYVFILNTEQQAELARRIAGGVISFRLDGPSSGADNLFSWDSGYGAESLGEGPILRLAISPPIVPVATAEERAAGLGTSVPTYVIITPAPTPENVLTAAAGALTATAWATMVGTPTPLPLNWVTPVVVTATPTPANEATATAWTMISTAVAILTGTPTPTPPNVWTATPTSPPTSTPLFIYLRDLPPVKPPTSTPATLPAGLVGKIAFLSNRRGEPAVYVMNADGSGVALLTGRWAYEFASFRQVTAADGNGFLSSDGRYIVYRTGTPGRRQVWIRNADGSAPRNISNNPYDEYDPIWLR